MVKNDVTFKKIEVPVEPTPAPAPNGMHLPKLTKKFILAGRALFTVSNNKGEHFTFKVVARNSEWPAGSGKKAKVFFLHVKQSGGAWPFQYIGMVNPDTGTVRCTAKSAFIVGDKPYNVGAWATEAVITGKPIPEGYEIQHAKMCGRCGMPLTTPESIERGIGPECWKKVI